MLVFESSNCCKRNLTVVNEYEKLIFFSIAYFTLIFLTLITLPIPWEHLHQNRLGIVLFDYGSTLAVPAHLFTIYGNLDIHKENLLYPLVVTCNITILCLD